MVLGPDGNYYGTATDGGERAGGTVFKLTPEGVLTRLLSFSRTHGNPVTTPIVGSDGNLYGTTYGGPDAVGDYTGSTSTIYRVSLAGALEILASFPNSSSSVAPSKLIQASDGNLYGTTIRGGADGRGSVFRLTPGGAFTTIFSFAATDASPSRGLVEGNDGNLYGTVSGGGADALGMIFRITPSGAFTPIYSFSKTSPELGQSPATDLTKAPDGTIYGVTSRGGANNSGVVFKVTTAGSLTAVASLPKQGDFGGSPSPVTFGDGGNLYGTTFDYFYRVSPDGALTILVHLTETFVTTMPSGPLLRTADGAFLGTTFAGTTFGTIHRLSESGGAAHVASFRNVIGHYFTGELSEGADGALYGAVVDDMRRAVVNPRQEAGTFKVSPSGVATRLGSFRTAWDFASPSRMIQAFGGELYGTYFHGGGAFGSAGGFIFQLPTDGFVTRFEFSGDWDLTTVKNPSSPLTRGPDGALYGTTSQGGAANGGTLFKFDSNFALTVLGSFNQSTGFLPRGDLVYSDGYFYGLTAGTGGSENHATFYRATPTGEISSITTLPWKRTNGCLLLANDGFFYGVTPDGGANNLGSIFRLSKTGVLSTFASMDATTGARPAGVIQARDGYFYGVAVGNGTVQPTVFRVDPDGGVQALHQFLPESGSPPRGNLMQASDGAFYGTADGGPTGYGVVYRLTVPPIGATNVQKRPEGGVRVRGTGVPLEPHTVKAADELAQTYVTIGTATADSSGNITFDDGDAANRERRFYRILYP